MRNGKARNGKARNGILSIFCEKCVDGSSTRSRCGMDAAIPSANTSVRVGFRGLCCVCCLLLRKKTLRTIREVGEFYLPAILLTWNSRGPTRIRNRSRYIGKSGVRMPGRKKTGTNTALISTMHTFKRRAPPNVALGPVAAVLNGPKQQMRDWSESSEITRVTVTVSWGWGLSHGTVYLLRKAFAP